jgi:hypothetical protein
VSDELETVRQVLLAYLKQDHPMDGTVALPGMDALDRMGTEIVRLRGELQEALRGEIARLRAALEAIRDAPPQSYDWYQSKARVALARASTSSEA